MLKASDVEGALLREVARILGESADNLDPLRSLSELGVDSVGYCTVSAFIERQFGIAVPPQSLFEFSSLRDTAAHVAELTGGQQPDADVGSAASRTALAKAQASYSTRDIAIIGVACKLPGADAPNQYWDLIRSGASVIREFPERREPVVEAGSPSYLKGGFVEDTDAFDAAFFGISPREALAMDPQQRLLLECAWHTFENAARSPPDSEAPGA
jgi:acyl carrier protein